MKKKKNKRERPNSYICIYVYDSIQEFKKKIKDNTERSLRDLLQTKVEKQKSRGKKKTERRNCALGTTGDETLYLSIHAHVCVCVYIPRAWQ